MRIFKVWFFDIFYELRKNGKIDFNHNYMGQPEYGGPHRERGHVVDILAQANLVNYHDDVKPKMLSCKANLINKLSNEKLWDHLEMNLPRGTKFTTFAQKKNSYILQWTNSEVKYTSEANYKK